MSCYMLCYVIYRRTFVPYRNRCCMRYCGFQERHVTPSAALVTDLNEHQVTIFHPDIAKDITTGSMLVFYLAREKAVC